MNCCAALGAGGFLSTPQCAVKMFTTVCYYRARTLERVDSSMNHPVCRINFWNAWSRHFSKHPKCDYAPQLGIIRVRAIDLFEDRSDSKVVLMCSLTSHSLLLYSICPLFFFRDAVKWVRSLLPWVHLVAMGTPVSKKIYPKGKPNVPKHSTLLRFGNDSYVVSAHKCT